MNYGCTDSRWTENAQSEVGTLKDTIDQFLHQEEANFQPQIRLDIAPDLNGHCAFAS